MKYRIFSLFYITIVFVTQMAAEDGSHLWLRLPTNARAQVSAPYQSSTLDIAVEELQKAWQGAPVRLVIQKDKQLKPEGFRIRCKDNTVILSAPTEKGLLYAAYHLLRLQQTTNFPLSDSKSQLTENPVYNLRILNHWDNMDRTIERGYAGQSLWNWKELPNTLSDRYKAYARANASIGINGTVLNNVNADPKILSAEYLQKVKALADIFRPYGLRVYLSVNFASPMTLDSLNTADPLNKEVIRWWKSKIKEIYRIIPDFGGFLVKANSEGQPGPCDFGRTHAEGANMLADALRPYKGIVMWRAFVYSPSDADRAKQAYLEFKPLDGQFRDNVIVQIKNGPIDFQPREPYSPLFGAMQYTPLMAEFQVTQEYLGHSNHLAYLAPMWKEFFRYVDPDMLRAVAGVTNIGDDVNWCGHDFAQANWYTFGRLAWNPRLSSEEIADEWLKQTFTSNKDFLVPMREVMLESREAVVNYMMPLGLHHIFAWGHHYGPEPWCEIEGARPDWLPSYYHRADSEGLGFDRSGTGSNAVSQYPDSLANIWGTLDTCPEEFLLWFHHVPWTYKLKDGYTLWEELCYKYDTGLKEVRRFRDTWNQMRPYIDTERYEAVAKRLDIQVNDAVWWKDACLLYFQSFSKMKFPKDIEKATFRLKELKKVHLPITNFECPGADILPRKE